MPGSAEEIFGQPASVLSEQPATSQVSGLCQITQTPAQDFVPLDFATFTGTLADLSASWMTPLHEALLGLDEPRVLEAMVETVAGTFDTNCRYETNYESLPPDEELIDPQNQADVRQAIIDYFEGATIYETGDQLRFSIYQCTTCSEPLGTEPVFFTARLTQDGTLVVAIELTEGSLFARNVTIGPNALGLQAPLGPISDWAKTASAAIRAGDTRLPEGLGTVTFGARKQGAGLLDVWLGISGLEIVSERGRDLEVTWRSTEDCLGMEVKLAPNTLGSTAGVNLGALDVFMSGQSHCPEGSSCGAKEAAGPWHYRVGGMAGILSQPALGTPADLGLLLRSQSESTAAVAGDVFARAGLGPSGLGGEVTLQSEAQAAGYLVTFQPALDMGGALAISQFSDEFRLDLPAWLNDEIFDLSFGGTPTAKILVPMREPCPQDGSTFLRPERREVQILEGSGQMAVGSGRILEASAGQCVGQSLTDPATYDLVSDFWEAGFTCQP